MPPKVIAPQSQAETMYYDGALGRRFASYNKVSIANLREETGVRRADVKICYRTTRFHHHTLRLILEANRIIAEYQAQGHRLTLRQLYYRFVSRDLLPNVPESYLKLTTVVRDGRLAGLIDWDGIEDRTTNVQSPSRWDSPEEIIRAAEEDYHIDMWANQPYRPEVWIEKEALGRVIERPCVDLDVPFLCCRRYNSTSEMWRAAMRLRTATGHTQSAVILYLGDHDPGGLDMSRGVGRRLAMFAGTKVDVKRLALNLDQIQRYSPPPNPVRTREGRHAAYAEQFGPDCWELDALEPEVIIGLVQEAVGELRDDALWESSLEREAAGRQQLHDMIEGLVYPH